MILWTTKAYVSLFLNFSNVTENNEKLIKAICFEIMFWMIPGPNAGLNYDCKQPSSETVSSSGFV